MNLDEVKNNIRNICSEYGRNPETVNLVAVSKKQPAQKLSDALDAGQRLFGENRVQEAYEHWEEYKKNYSDLRLHLIGPLQTNKVKDAVSLFDMIETLDRKKLAQKLSQEMQKQKRHIPCLIQVNTGEESQKAGILPVDLSSFLDFCTHECGLNIRGLMCIPPVSEPATLHFAFLHKLAQQYNLPELSMGMSSDYQLAIPLGATYVRVGTGVFGQREY